MSDQPTSSEPPAIVSPEVGPGAIRRAILPLRLIFWGGLLCLFDYSHSRTVNGSGYSFDFLNDALGLAMIGFAVWRLRLIGVHRRYRVVLWFVLAVTMLNLLEAASDHVIVPDVHDLYGSFSSVVGLATQVATVLFCVAMMWLCRSAGTEAARRSWLLTALLFVIVYLLPLGGLFAAFLWVAVFGGGFHINLPPWALLFILPAFAAPLVHLFVSTSRMKRAAQALHPPDAPPGPTPLLERLDLIPMGMIVGVVFLGVALANVAQDLVTSDTVHRLWPSLTAPRVLDGLTSQSWGASFAADGTAVRMTWASNPLREVRLVVISQKTRPDDEDDLLSFSSNAPLAGLLSTVSLKTGWPADPDDSGLWVDGVHRPLDKPFTLIYVSDQTPAVDVPISDAEREGFLSDMKGNDHVDPNELVAKWITPRLDRSTPVQ